MGMKVDTDKLPPGLRAKAWVTAIIEMTAPSHVDIANADVFRGRLEWWALDDVDVLSQQFNSGLRVRRTTAQVRRHPSRTVSIGVIRTGLGRHEQFGVRRIVRPGHLVVTDLAAPYEYTFDGEGSSQAIHVDLTSLAISSQTVRRAASRLEVSPLCSLVDDHIAEVTNSADMLSGADYAYGLGSGSIPLIQALLTSAATGGIESDYGRVRFATC